MPEVSVGHPVFVLKWIPAFAGMTCLGRYSQGNDN
jgi:hypothetical protein